METLLKRVEECRCDALDQCGERILGKRRKKMIVCVSPNPTDSAHYWITLVNFTACVDRQVGVAHGGLKPPNPGNGSVGR